MKNFSKLFIVAALGVFGADATAEPIVCKGCDPPKQEDSHREQIKADRAKYDRENEKVTARPWDLVKGDKLQPEKSK
jgi:hypothetical protein